MPLAFTQEDCLLFILICKQKNCIAFNVCFKSRKLTFEFIVIFCYERRNLSFRILQKLTNYRKLNYDVTHVLN